MKELFVFRSENHWCCPLPSKCRKRNKGKAEELLSLLPPLAGGFQLAGTKQNFLQWKPMTSQSTHVLSFAQDKLPAFTCIVYFFSSIKNHLKINSFRKLFITVQASLLCPTHVYININVNNNSFNFMSHTIYDCLHILCNIILITFLKQNYYLQFYKRSTQKPSKLLG